jgi:6-phosphogluconolactonase
VVANYGDGTLAAYPLGADGRIGALSQMVQHRGRGANPERQEGPHAHFVAFAPDNRFALSCDLGIDKVLVYRFTSADGQLEQHGEAALPPGAGPRHLEVHPNGRYAYVISELNATLTVFSYAAESGKLAELQTISTLPADYSGPKSAAEVLAHPSGRFVYASNRGHNSIAMFAADEASGTLTWLGHASTRGETPRSFAIDPAGAFLLAANQDSDTVASFRIDAQSGMLQYLQSIAVPKPVCLTFRR